MEIQKQMKIFGQEVDVLKNQVLALILNIWAWGLSFLWNPRRKKSEEFDGDDPYVVISSPGGLDKLELQNLGMNKATQGYNVSDYARGQITIDVSNHQTLPADAVVVSVSFFSINYADIAIRWGLYESALRYYSLCVQYHLLIRPHCRSS